MKLSFSTLGCPHYGIDEIINLAVSNGYQGVEIRAVKGTVDIAGLAEFKGNGLSETAKKFRDAGLEVVCVGTSIRFAEADKKQQDKQLEDAKVAIEITNTLDCKYIRTFGGPVPYRQSYSETLNWIWEGYNKLCTLTKAANIIPLLETHDDFSTSARVLEIINGVDSGKLGACWDIAHPLRFGEPISETVAALKDHIYHVHIKDASEYSPQGTDFPLVGEGKIPIANCISALSSANYKAYLSFEWEKLWHMDIPEPEIAIPHYAKTIKKFF